MVSCVPTYQLSEIGFVSTPSRKRRAGATKPTRAGCVKPAKRGSILETNFAAQHVCVNDAGTEVPALSNPSPAFAPETGRCSESRSCPKIVCPKNDHGPKVRWYESIWTNPDRAVSIWSHSHSSQSLQASHQIHHQLIREGRKGSDKGAADGGHLHLQNHREAPSHSGPQQTTRTTADRGFHHMRCDWTRSQDEIWWNQEICWA